ncbi:MAG: TonB-dependent receptor [Rhodothermales bacterium]|nr:TonB-dependent receptor [Rhodothermales bacterium]MBO6778360.1 TonB-dependent receptor [Rhodothermales bacterium]
MTTRSWGITLAVAGLSLTMASQGQARQFATIEGTVRSEGQAVAYASVRLPDLRAGVAASEAGVYSLKLPTGTEGSITVLFTAIGYQPLERSVEIQGVETIRLDVELIPTVYESGALVVTGTMTEITTAESPVKVNLLPSRFLETVPTSNLMEVIDRVNGLYQQIDCGVCYTNNIRINGIDGPNTAVLIDGMPMMSSLAAVYGLNGISPMLIKQVEVVKGPMSTLYGSEALGGVVNIRTKDPGSTPRFSANAYTTQHREHVAEASAVALRGRTNLLVSGTLLSAQDYHDNNADGFSDRPFQSRVALFAKGTRTDALGFDRASVVAKFYHEDREAGVESFLKAPKDLRGSGATYGESIFTRRAELMATVRATSTLNVASALSLHDQDSFYGDSGYQAQQTDGFLQATWTPFMPAAREHHDLLIGLAMRYQRYDDGSGVTGRYDDSGTLLENQPDTRLIPGLFVQDDVEVTDRLRVLGGLRLDYQPDHGLIPSPRLATKVELGDLTTLRLNVGTGFRVVNLFTEDHAAYTGGRATVILEDLNPERSVSTAGSIQHILTGMGSPITVDFDAFWTRFSNKIEPDYDTPGEVRYRNLRGHYATRGVALQVQGNVTGGVSYSVAGTLMDVYVEEDGTRRDHEFAPAYQGTATITWQAPNDVVLDYTARVTGPMQMPGFEPSVREAYRQATGVTLHERSPTYAVHNLQATRDFRSTSGRLLQVYVALENLTGFKQSSPLVGYYEGTPGFGDSFDTAYVYGPIEGRHFGAGVRLILP